MMYFLFVDWIEKFLKWAKNYGSKVYWSWMGILAISGLIMFIILKDNTEIWMILIYYVLFWLVGIIPVSIYENRWKKQKEQKENKHD